MRLFLVAHVEANGQLKLRRELQLRLKALLLRWAGTIVIKIIQANLPYPDNDGPALPQWLLSEKLADSGNARLTRCLSIMRMNTHRCITVVARQGKLHCLTRAAHIRPHTDHSNASPNSLLISCLARCIVVELAIV